VEHARYQDGGGYRPQRSWRPGGCRIARGPPSPGASYTVIAGSASRARVAPILAPCTRGLRDPAPRRKWQGGVVAALEVAPATHDVILPGALCNTMALNDAAPTVRHRRTANPDRGERGVPLVRPRLLPAAVRSFKRYGQVHQQTSAVAAVRLGDTDPSSAVPRETPSVFLRRRTHLDGPPVAH
jgi:hypothetical protein